MGYVYKITNNVNGKIYIGQTRVTEPQRWQQHIWHAYNDSDNDSLLLCRAIKKYGKENFTRTILEECDNQFLNEREKYWINYFDSTNHDIGYNVAEGGKGHLKYSNEEIVKAYTDFGSITKASKAIGMSREQMSIRLQAMGIQTTREIPVCQYDLQGNFIKEYSTMADAAKETNTPIYHIREQGVYNKFLWLYKNNTQTPKERLNQLSNLVHNLLDIQQYNEFGELVAEFSNAAEASRKTGINISSIKAASDGKQVSAGGFLWVRVYGGLSLEETLNKYLLSSSCCKIEEIDINGQVINTFDSCNKAEKFYGYGGNSIKPVCDGKRKTARGKTFRWQNPLKRRLLGLE